MLDGTTQRKVRLLGIDAPEQKQAFGARAKEALSELAFGREVRVVWKARDRYGRTLGDVHVGDQWVNRTMVERGMAWAYRASKRSALKAAETAAREARRGLWAEGAGGAVGVSR